MVHNVAYPMKLTRSSDGQKNEYPPPSGYETGAKVRLISGVDNSHIPGYHFMHGFVTVCRIEADWAEFIGVRKENLRVCCPNIEDKNDN